MAACDAIVSPVITGHPDLAIADQMIDIILARLDTAEDGDHAGLHPRLARHDPVPLASRASGALRMSVRHGGRAVPRWRGWPGAARRPGGPAGPASLLAFHDLVRITAL